MGFRQRPEFQSPENDGHCFHQETMFPCAWRVCHNFVILVSSWFLEQGPGSLKCHFSLVYNSVKFWIQNRRSQKIKWTLLAWQTSWRATVLVWFETNSSNLNLLVRIAVAPAFGSRPTKLNHVCCLVAIKQTLVVATLTNTVYFLA